jgi:hypothetical protein
MHTASSPGLFPSGDHGHPRMHLQGPRHQNAYFADACSRFK